MTAAPRYYQVAGITWQVESDLPIGEGTFHEKFEGFRAEGPGPDTVVLRHHFGLPDVERRDLGREIYHRPPWAVYRTERSWVYAGIGAEPDDPSFYSLAYFSPDHSRGDLFNDSERERWWREGGLTSLTMFPTDQIVLARLLALRQGCLLHSGGLTIDGGGLIFVGHAEAGKSTTMDLVRRALGARVRILCDDRNVVRRWPDGFRVHGTWSHGDVTDVSGAEAPLRAVLFLEQHSRNEIVPLEDRREVWHRLLATLIRPVVTADWWNREIDVLEGIVAEVPCFTMRFDRSGSIVPELARLVR